MSALDFQSPWWLPEGHTQTLWRRFMPGNNIRQRRQRVELADGDFIDVDWVEADAVTAPKDLPIVFLLHGLCGSAGSPYIQSLQRLLKQRGYTSLAMNFRGCSGEINRLARAYHSGCIDDVEEVYQCVRHEVGDRPFAFAGFSLGGNVLLNWLAQLGPSHRILGGVAVSTPFSLACCSEALNSGISTLYGSYFRRRLVRDVEAKRAYFRHKGWHEEGEKLARLGDLQRLRTLWEFDDQVTAPLHGFSDAPDYYTRCSSGLVLTDIRVPTVLIQSSNDPIIPMRSLPDTAKFPAAMRLVLTDAGGHVGFTSASDPLWLERRIFEAIEQLD